jgi:hypothetical protein
VNANLVGNNLSLMINDGTGTFGAPTFFDSGLSTEYGLVAADMNNDGITDVLVASRNGQQLVTMLGNGNGTFTASTPQSTGGQTWVVVVGDVNGDGTLDAVTANSFSNNGGINLGNGDGTFAPPTTVNVGAHVPSADLGDLDGDGDLDLVMSSFGGSLWRLFTNDGAGVFTFAQDIAAPSNPSCAVLFDFDNDLDLDMGLTDEIADVIVLMENVANATSVVEPAHSGALFLLPNAPNPFSESTTVRYYLTTEQDPAIDVFDVLGRRVATHGSLPGPVGWTQVLLPATDAVGRPLANGVYFYRVRAGGEAVTGRLVVRR